MVTSINSLSLNQVSQGKSLLDAVENGSFEDVQRLLNLGVNPNAANNWGNTPLLLAIDKGNAAIVKLLLENGADPNCTDDYGTIPLHKSVEKEDESIIKYLLADNRILVDQQNIYKTTALDVALRECNSSMLRILLGAGATSNDERCLVAAKQFLQEEEEKSSK